MIESKSMSPEMKKDLKIIGIFLLTMVIGGAIFHYQYGGDSKAGFLASMVIGALVAGMNKARFYNYKDKNPGPLAMAFLYGMVAGVLGFLGGTLAYIIVTSGTSALYPFPWLVWISTPLGVGVGGAFGWFVAAGDKGEEIEDKMTLVLFIALCIGLAFLFYYVS